MEVVRGIRDAVRTAKGLIFIVVRCICDKVVLHVYSGIAYRYVCSGVVVMVWRSGILRYAGIIFAYTCTSLTRGPSLPPSLSRALPRLGDIRAFVSASPLRSVPSLDVVRNLSYSP